MPGLCVNRLFKGEKFEHKIEILKTAEHDTSNKGSDATKASEDPRELIAQMAAQEFKTGMNCNLGVGIPMAASFAASTGTHVFLQSENGMTGCGPYPKRGRRTRIGLMPARKLLLRFLVLVRLGVMRVLGKFVGGIWI